MDCGEVGEPPKKPRLDKAENRSSPIAFQTKDIPMGEFTYSDETNADDFAMEMGLVCVVCRCVMFSRNILYKVDLMLMKWFSMGLICNFCCS